MNPKETIDEINRLMNEFEDISFRPIPYLGLVWRDIEPDFENKIRFSKPDHSIFYYLDMAWKWDYPTVELTLDEAHPILEKMLTVLEGMMGLTEDLEKLKSPTEEATIDEI